VSEAAMAESAINDKERVTLRVAGQGLDVVHMSGEEAISRLFRFDFVCRAEADAPAPDDLLAAEAEITLFDGFGVERSIHGIVSDASTRVSDDGSAELRVTLRPHAYVLALGRDSRVYQHKTVVDIIKEVIGRSPQKTRWEVVSSYTPHEYCAQYREDDWSFLSRMLEEEGIHFWFEHEAGATTMVFDDDAKSAPDIQGGADIVYAVESGMSADRERIDEIGERVEAQPTRFTIGSFNANKPLLRVLGGAGDGPFEVYDAPGGGPDTPDGCTRRAGILREAAAAKGAGVVGTSSSVRLVPGMVMNVVDHPFASGDGRCLITRTRYEVRQRQQDSGSREQPYICHFEGIHDTVPFRPSAEAPPAKQAGLQAGVVVGAAGEEIFPDASGAVRVQLRWDREGAFDDKAGKWMRVAQRGTEESMLLPRVGFNVLTYNEEGEVDAPSVLARIHDAEHTPTYGLPANKTRVVFKTATTPGGGSFNEIYFEDKKGQEELFMNASKDMTVLAQKVKSSSVQRDSCRNVGIDHTLTVGSDWTENVIHNQRVSIGAGESIEIGRNRLKEVKGNESVRIGGNRSLSAGYQHTLAVTQNRSLNVGSAIVEVTAGSMATVAGDNIAILIGGADLKVAAKSISTDVGKVATQVIGAAKVELSAKDMPADTGKKYTEQVGGAMMLTAGGAFLDGATESSSWTVSAAMMSAAPDIYVEAIDKTEIKCGESVLTLVPGTIEISSPAFDLSGAELKVETKKVEHN